MKNLRNKQLCKHLILKIFIFTILFSNLLYAGKGSVKFENKTNTKIIIKFITTNNETYEKTINSNNSWRQELSQKFGTPDIEKMWVKFIDGTRINLGDYYAISDYLDYRRWSTKINIKNKQETSVKITYNKDKNQFERMVTRDGEIKEEYLENIGSPAEASMMLKNETNQKITINFKLANTDWITQNINPKHIYTIRVGKSHQTVTKDLNHMTVEFTNPINAEKNGYTIEKRWWPNTINNKRKQRTIIKINYDKENDRFTRLAFRRGKIRESLNKNIGTKFSGSYLDLPVQPKKQQLDIIQKIAKISGEIGKLEIEKTSIKTAKKVALAGLEGMKLSALGLSNLAEKATKGTLSLINIKNAEFSGSVRAIAKGTFPKLHIDYEILGKPKEINIQLDINNPEKSLEKLGTDINSDVKENIEAEKNTVTAE